MLLQVCAGRTCSPFSICPACKINLHLQMWKWVFLGSPTQSIFMNVLFMLVSCCSLPVFSQVNSFFHMEILPSLQIHFHACQVAGAGAGFSQRSLPLAGRRKRPLVTWGDWGDCLNAGNTLCWSTSKCLAAFSTFFMALHWDKTYERPNSRFPCLSQG